MISLYEIFHWICSNFLNFYWYFQPTVNNHAHFSPSFLFCPPFFSHLSADSHQKDTLMVFMLCSALGPDCSGCTKHLFLFKGCFRRCKMNFLLGGNNVIICVVCLVFGRPGQQSRSLLWPINKVVSTSTSLKNWPSNITCQQPENTPQLEQDNKTTSPELFQLLPPDFFNEDKDFCFSSRDPGVCVRVCVSLESVWKSSDITDDANVFVFLTSWLFEKLTSVQSTADRTLFLVSWENTDAASVYLTRNVDFHITNQATLKTPLQPLAQS